MSFDIKEVSEALGGVVKENNEALEKKFNEKIEALEDTVLEVKKSSLANEKGFDEEKAKSVIVNTFKKVKKFGISSEEQFAEVLDAEVKATYQNETTATDGAEFVFDLFSRSVYSIFEKFDLVKELSTLNITGKSINLPRYDGGVEAYWIDEGANFTSSKASTGNIKVDIYKLGVLVSLTDEMMADDMTTETLFNLIITETGVKFALKIEDEVLNGTSGKMEGILTNSDVKVVTSNATAFKDITEEDIIGADGLIDTKYDLNPNNKIAVMKKTTLNSLKVKRDPSTGVLLYPELRLPTPMLNGYRVVLTNRMPAEAASAVAILFGNVKDFYYHVSRQGFSSEMGHLANDFQTGKKSLRVDRRDGGKVKDGNAFAVVKLAAA